MTDEMKIEENEFVNEGEVSEEKARDSDARTVEVDREGNSSTSTTVDEVCDSLRRNSLRPSYREMLLSRKKECDDDKSNLSAKRTEEEALKRKERAQWKPQFSVSKLPFKRVDREYGTASSNTAVGKI
jgi:hypothetical protein